jgi:hypothetical protein
VRTCVFFAVLAFATLAAAQPRAEPPRYGYALGDRITDAVVVSRYSAERADAIEAVLAERGIQVTPMTLDLAAELNPAVDLRHPLAAHRSLVLPMARVEPASPEDLAYIDPALAARRAGRMLAAFDRAQVDPAVLDEAGREVLAAFARRFREHVVPLDPDAVAEWSGNGEAILELAASADPQAREGALDVARESNGMLDAVALEAPAANPLLEFAALRIAGTDPPGGAVPAGCRIRYALRADAYLGPLVTESRANDAAVSDCTRGTALLRKGLPYAVWAEWPSGKRMVRTRWRPVPATLAGLDPIDLPLRPIE